MVRNLLKLPFKTTSVVLRRLSRFLTARQFLAVMKVDDNVLKEIAILLSPVSEEVFEESESQKRARAIMGNANFFGIAAVKHRFGDFTAEELEARKEVRILNEATGELFSEEETLLILQACKDTHILVATKNIALPEMHARHKDRFNNDRNAPFFSQDSERKKWSEVTIVPPWLLVRKGPVPGSGSKDIDAQKEHVDALKNERMILPCEYVFAALLYYLETGKKLCEGYVVRFSVQTTDGNWVSVDWHGDELYVAYWNRHAVPAIVSGSVRTS